MNWASWFARALLVLIAPLGLHSHLAFHFLGETKLGTHNQLFKSCKMVSLSFNSEVVPNLYVYGYTGIYTGILVYIRVYRNPIYGFGQPYI